ncbi:TetR/AcrR family transcriptional regulator [Tenuifilum thalassicum]|uniref:TetR/AcrR family transcriptional regulator n=1 Tax=Tenuifilum thalassicum TaxID=2590900 RepID=A0A7D4BAB9_9BACT|nr:TetR/AcrR family transcriptional regulator [Tenuifilum thalassicum]QKG79300.1 TetR/AcrR family transcriptional regulator [Tenuifilum thalassicum]
MNQEFDHIVAKVREMYAKYGIKSVTMDDVSRNLGISKKTLYRYVTDKNELVDKVIDYEIEQLNKGMNCVEKDRFNAIEELLIVSKILNHKMKAINLSTIYDLRKYYPLLYERLTKARREKMISSVISNIEKGQKEGFYRTDLNPSIIARLQISRIESFIDNDIFTLDEMSSENFFKEVFIYHIRGIANQKGIEFLEHKMRDFDINELFDAEFLTQSI